MDALEKFIKTYTEELRRLIGQIPKERWIIFPDFFYTPYIIRARKCPNGVAILFKRPAKHESITIRNSKKRAEEVFLPYLPPPSFAVFGWMDSTRILIQGLNLINWDCSIDPAKGKKFQSVGENFRRMGVMHIDKSCEVQMINCRFSGVSDLGRVRLLIRFLWMITENCVELAEDKARSYANDDFARFLNHVLFLWRPSQPSTRVKAVLITMLKELQSKFEELISRTDVDEPEVQDFLEDHTSIIDLKAKRALSKESLGKTNQADFILVYDDSIRVVEIKKPFDPIFERKVLSSVARLALSELRRYQNWLELNELETKQRYGSAILEKGWGIIGRVKNIEKEQMKELILHNSKSETTTIRTYDDLLKNFALRICQIEKL